jgi:hypothetical protein
VTPIEKTLQSMALAGEPRFAPLDNGTRRLPN